MNDRLARLAEAYGIAPDYVSESGEHRVTSDAAKRGVLRALGVEIETDADLEKHTAAALHAHGTTQAEPSRCFIPYWLKHGKAWGIMCQLYGLRSSRNAGIGDFEDLARLAELAAGLEADFVGINPLHALFMAAPERTSPYSPSSRRFLNPLYIALDRVGAASLPVPEAPRASDLVDYPEVGRWKREALASRFRGLGTGAFVLPAERSFKDFAAEHGEALRLFALFEALSQSMVSKGRTAGWHGWPVQLQNPASPEVKSFAEANGDLICFHMWLQWIADEQLAEVHRRARAAGMRLGLYLDIAVGVAPDGAETWMDRGSVVAGARIGSPPDPFNEHGQDWGLAPLSPITLREHECAGFVSVIDAAMHHAGAVRLDHAMGLMRLYWIPEGSSAKDGAYIHYPLDELMGHLAVASHRHRAIVIGEDLGTVPHGFRDILRSFEIQGCRVLYFERDGTAFRGPESYPCETMASVATHDLPTLGGWWTGNDIEQRQRTGIFSADRAVAERTLRMEERRALVARLAASGLADQGMQISPGRLPDEICVAVHRFLARAPSRLVAVQLEDLLGMAEQANLPGTIDEHPNWRRKLPCDLDEIAHEPLFRKIVAAMTEERPRK